MMATRESYINERIVYASPQYLYCFNEAFPVPLGKLFGQPPYTERVITAGQKQMTEEVCHPLRN
jgi:hypothetical protein